MKIILVLSGIIISSLFSLDLSAQHIEMEKLSFGRHKLTQDGEILRYYELKQIFAEQDKTRQSYKKYSRNHSMAFVISGLAGVMIGYSVSNIYSGLISSTVKPAAYRIGLAGIVMGLVAIPFQKKANKYLIQTVDLYNNDLSIRTKAIDAQLQFSSSGVAFLLHF